MHEVLVNFRIIRVKWSFYHLMNVNKNIDFIFQRPSDSMSQIWNELKIAMTCEQTEWIKTWHIRSSFNIIDFRQWRYVRVRYQLLFQWFQYFFFMSHWSKTNIFLAFPPPKKSPFLRCCFGNGSCSFYSSTSFL